MLVLFACAPSPSPHDPTPISSSTTRPPAPTWDPAPAPVACPLDDPDPVLDAALSDAGLDRDGVTYDATSWSANAYQADLDDPFRLSWFRGVHDAPLRVSCDARQVAADLDAVLDAPHPAAVAIGLAMARLGVDPVGQPVDPAALDPVDLPGLPTDLADALQPILAAMAAVAEARDRMEAAAPDSAKDLVEYGHAGALIDYTTLPDLQTGSVRHWVDGPDGPAALYDPARALAFAIEDADLPRFAGLDLTADLDTPVGRLIVAGPGPDEPGDTPTSTRSRRRRCGSRSRSTSTSAATTPTATSPPATAPTRCSRRTRTAGTAATRTPGRSRSPTPGGRAPGGSAWGCSTISAAAPTPTRRSARARVGGSSASGRWSTTAATTPTSARPGSRAPPRWASGSCWTRATATTCTGPSRTARGSGTCSAPGGSPTAAGATPPSVGPASAPVENPHPR